jgi:hypothetical protein
MPEQEVVVTDESDDTPTVVTPRSSDRTRRCPACGGSGVDEAGNLCPVCLGISSEVWVER